MSNALAPSGSDAPAALLRTLSDWLLALARGTDTVPALKATRSAAQAAASLHLWTHLCPEDRWAAQIATLRARLAESADRSALLARYLLLGVPYAAKNLFDIEGVTTVAGSKIERAQPPAASDAVLVQRLQAAGAVLLAHSTWTSTPTASRPRTRMSAPATTRTT